jgi:hypothetical protein
VRKRSSLPQWALPLDTLASRTRGSADERPAVRRQHPRRWRWPHRRHGSYAGSARADTARPPMSAHGTPASASSAKMRINARWTGFSVEATLQASPRHHRTQPPDGGRTRRSRARPIPARKSRETHDAAVGEAFAPRRRSVQMQCAVFSAGVSRSASDMTRRIPWLARQRASRRDSVWTRSRQTHVSVDQSHKKRGHFPSRRGHRAGLRRC